MPIEQIITLAFVQGLTEFLPVSSSAHLALVPTLTGWKDQGIFMDVAVHLGTLVAVLVYFYKDLMRLIGGTFSLVRRNMTGDAWLALYILLGTIPVVIIGYIFDKYVGDGLRSVSVIAWSMIIFGIVLYGADRMGHQTYTIDQTTTKKALFFGFFQSIALINGVSRSGILLTVGRLMHYKRAEAARFAFLLSIPTITAAGILKGYQFWKVGDTSLLSDAMLAGFFSMIAGLFAISFMMRWLQSRSLTPFVVYRIVLGIILLVWFSGS